jgi:gliding motility-associated-like protein
MAETFYGTRSITSIHLDSFPGANDFEINLIWNQYDGWNNREYKIYVGEYDVINDTMIFDELLANNLPTQDTTYLFTLPCDPEAEEDKFYWVKVEAFDPSGAKPYLSHSNYVLTKCPGNPIIPPPPPPAIRPIQVPNVFTPNNDGNNDLFEIANIGDHKDAKLIIKDRWGGTVFEANNYETSNPWNGTNKNTGGMVADGTYFYILQYFDNIELKVITLNGSITVFKN